MVGQMVTLPKQIEESRMSCYEEVKGLLNIERLDSKELASIGIAFETDDETHAFAEFIREELEVRIGKEISKHLTDKQLDEFDRCSTQASASRFLDNNCPEFRSIVRQQKDEFENEIIRYKSIISGVHPVSTVGLDKVDLPRTEIRDGLMDDLEEEFEDELMDDYDFYKSEEFLDEYYSFEMTE